MKPLPNSVATSYDGCIYSFLFITHVWGLDFPSRPFGFRGQIPGTGRPALTPRLERMPHQEHIYSITLYLSDIRDIHFVTNYFIPDSSFT